MPRVAAALAVVVVAVCALGGGGCGSATRTVAVTGPGGQVTTRTVPSVHFAKTKFVLHVGLAFGAFHRYIDEPLRAGAFRSGAPGRGRALLKAAAAALFAVHELKVARQDALSDDRLRPLAEKAEGLFARLGSLGSGLRSGALDAGAITRSAGEVSSLGAASGALGTVVKDIPSTL